MADSDVATKPAAEGGEPSATVDSVEAQPPPSAEPVASADPPPPTVNGVPDHPASDAAAEPAAPVATAKESPSKSGGTGPSTGAPRIDVSDDTGRTTTTNKYEVHDKDSEAADRVAAALKSARLHVSKRHFYAHT